MKRIYILCLVSSLLSCSEEKISDFTFPDIDIEFYLKASDGIDLLNPENEQALTETDISIYYLDNINGDNKVKVDQNVYSISYIDTTHLYRFRTLVNEKTSNNYSYTTIKWGNRGEDTIKCSIKQPYHIKQIDTVWINNKLIWEFQKGPKIFNLIK